RPPRWSMSSSSTKVRRTDIERWRLTRWWFDNERHRIPKNPDRRGIPPAGHSVFAGRADGPADHLARLGRGGSHWRQQWAGGDHAADGPARNRFADGLGRRGHRLRRPDRRLAGDALRIS